MAGELFKKRREELGLEIKAVADALRINHEYLFAIEEDSFEKLPVAVYAVGYIRCYANYLGIDAGPVIQHFTSHLTSPKPSTIIPVSSSRRGFSKKLYIIFGILTGVVIFSVFLYTADNLTDTITTKKSVSAVKENDPISSLPVVADSVSEKMPAETEPQEIRMDETVPAAMEKASHQLDINALDTVWLQVKFTDGKVEDMLLRAGISEHWEFNGSATLKIGNAGGVTLKFDGKDLGSPGNPGQVVDLTFPPM